jgi:hypothetical protein
VKVFYYHYVEDGDQHGPFNDINAVERHMADQGYFDTDLVVVEVEVPDGTDVAVSTYSGQPWSEGDDVCDICMRSHMRCDQTTADGRTVCVECAEEWDPEWDEDEDEDEDEEDEDESWIDEHGEE